MKKILAIAAAAALTAGVSAFAANPFSDVSTDDWAYQAVSDLSDQGVVEGYPDGTFKGERNITRYELAQIIARLMAKEDQLNAEQRATLDKLAGEYADELANLGVRVSNLEKKVGNIYWSGDARMQYQHNLKSDKENGVYAKEHDDAWTGRMRINVKGQVNDQVTVNGRFVTNMYFKNADEDDGDTTMDRIYSQWTPNDKTTVNIGRFGVALDQTGTFWDEDGVFDGINAAWDNGKIGVEAGYGRFKDAGNEVAEDGESGMWKDRASTEAWYGKLTGHFNDRADLSAFYLENTHKANGTEGIDHDSPKAHVWGAGTTVDLGGNFNLDGDFVQTKLNKGNGHANLWTAGLTYGAVDTDKPGTWQLGVHYVKADAGAMLLGNSALDLTDQLDYGYDKNADVHFWVARAGVALQKGVELDAYYNFAAKASGIDEHVDDPDDTWGIELNYAF
ncbi:S-layer homology domain-containing protein [uncultured Dialister sp.]|uniref:S-layer homology domain-containing protein n=1 Tax=uncultured Dialister sp. TaxID=278064 RepID=UPI002674D5E7|nr:S-layer homology domain-containing protein [uncultured Dialister sp.]